MEEILENNTRVIQNQNYSDTVKKQSIYSTFIKLVNFYLETHKDYPFKRWQFEYKYHIVPLGNYTDDVITDENIKNFLLDNGIKNDKDFISFRDKAYRNSYMAPLVFITTTREKQLDEKTRRCFII